MKKNLTHKITESAVLLALATILSVIKLVDMPVGGSVTLCSMLPVLLISYRFSPAFGFLGGFVYSVIQLILGTENLSYATSALATVAIILFDYLLPFTLIAVGGIFKKFIKNQAAAITVGMATASVIRYICHTISGCTVWAGLLVPSKEALIYSLSYNATYMLPELIIGVVGAFYLSLSVDFSSERLRRLSTSKSGVKVGALSVIGKVLAAVTLILDVVLIAPHLQNTESGELFMAGIKNINLTALLIVTVLGIFLTAACSIIPKILTKKD